MALNNILGILYDECAWAQCSNLMELLFSKTKPPLTGIDPAQTYVKMEYLMSSMGSLGSPKKPLIC